MSIVIDQWIDGAIGETRHALVKEGKPFALVITRWSDIGRRARWGEVYVGRVRAVERALRGAFVDLGLKDEQGFLPLDSSGQARLRGDHKRPVREGEIIVVGVEREGARGKGPNLAIQDTPAPQDKLGRIDRHRSDMLRDDAPPASTDDRAALDGLIDDLLNSRVDLAGGGRLLIEPTAALTAIDVDAAGRKGGADPEQFALTLNLEAAEEALRQLRLRNLGGQAVIDFVSMRKAESRKALEDKLKDLRPHDPWGPIFAPLSRFGMMELTRAQMMRPLHETLRSEDGRKSTETVALEALRAIERETQSVRGRRIVAGVAQDVSDWLDGNIIPWRDALNARIGTMWAIEPLKGAAREKIDVRAL